MRNSTLKNLVIFGGIGCVVALLLFGCGGDDSKPEPRAQTGNAKGDTTKSSTNSTGNTLNCVAPTCSGDECCEDDRECKKKCRDLDIASGDCDDLPIETVDAIDNLLSDKGVFDNPNDKDLESLEVVDYTNICIATNLDKTDADVWEKVVKEHQYGSGDAEVVMRWFVEQEDATDILEEIESQRSTDILVRLLFIIGGGSHSGSISGNDGIEDIIAGLGSRIDDGARESQSVMVYAHEEAKDTRIMKLIHNHVVKSDELCDTPANQPVPISSNTRGVRYKKEACQLAVYCEAITDADQREGVARDLSDNRINSFIKAAVSEDGGLGISGDYEDWPNTACAALKAQWNNPASGLDLGLGS